MKKISLRNTNSSSELTGYFLYYFFKGQDYGKMKKRWQKNHYWSFYGFSNFKCTCCTLNLFASLIKRNQASIVWSFFLSKIANFRLVFLLNLLSINIENLVFYDKHDLINVYWEIKDFYERFLIFCWMAFFLEEFLIKKLIFF